MKELADLMFPNVQHDIAYYEQLYPLRNVKEGQIVTRFAPSPTGFVHIGSLLTAFIAQKIAKQTDGVYYLRIEDTDQLRSVDNGIVGILNGLGDFDIHFDEGMTSETEEIGHYGPYMQSKRKEIYNTFAHYLVEQGNAYPCFCSEEEMNQIRTEQERIKDRIGYYGHYARDRNLPLAEQIKRIQNGESYVTRLKSPGDFHRKVIVQDLVRGKVEFPENDLDIVLIKSDGLPLYHFAHLVDDYLMRTTHIIRSDEWLSSTPIHIQLFQMFDFLVPKYAHTSPLMKEEEGSRRKISKRKDPEAAVSYYHAKGIPYEAVNLYLMTVANSNFEIWMDQNQGKTIDDFVFDFKKVSSSGALFDLDKLLNISKTYLSRLSAKEIYDRSLTYTTQYDSEMAQLLIKYREYSIKVFNIEREQKKPRKDLSCFSEVKDQTWYLYDELFDQNDSSYAWGSITDLSEIKSILTTYMDQYFDPSDDKDTWFHKIKELATLFGYAGEVKEYKENPDQYKGHVGDISMVIRVAVTTKSMTPDLYDVLNLLGKERIQKRIQKIS